jgi:RNA polymerase sigma-70 factor (ECF subfamily)
VRAVHEAGGRDLSAERALVERAQQGDRAALGSLLHTYGPQLYRAVLLPRLGSEAAARDALSETYERVCTKLSQFTWQNLGFYPWFRTVGLRVALDQLRARKRLVLFDADDLQREVDRADTETPLDVAVGAERDLRAAKLKMDAALGQINERYRRAIVLRVLEERPRDEVAKELGVSAATFDVVLHRAMQALKRALESGAEPGARKEDDGTVENKGHG